MEDDGKVMLGWASQKKNLLASCLPVIRVRYLAPFPIRSNTCVQVRDQRENKSENYYDSDWSSNTRGKTLSSSQPKRSSFRSFLQPRKELPASATPVNNSRYSMYRRYMSEFSLSSAFISSSSSCFLIAFLSPIRSFVYTLSFTCIFKYCVHSNKPLYSHDDLTAHLCFGFSPQYHDKAPKKSFHFQMRSNVTPTRHVCIFLPSSPGEKKNRGFLLSVPS